MKYLLAFISPDVLHRVKDAVILKDVDKGGLKNKDSKDKDLKDK